MNPAKPYFIQVYNSTNNSLSNKYKFVLAAQYVKDLKNLLRQKLKGKKQIEDTTQIILKDNDDFQLGSDDQVNDVVPDCKVKVYKKDNNSSIIIPSAPSVVFQAPQSHPSVTAVNSQPNNIALKFPEDGLVISQDLIDLTKFTIPVLGQGVLKVKYVFPQIRKAPIQIAFNGSISTFYDLSKYILQQVGLSEGLYKAIIYNQKGQPLLYNFDLSHTNLPKLDWSQLYYVILTRSYSSVDTPVPQINPIQANISQITVEYLGKNLTIKIDLDNLLPVLHKKIFQKIGVHPLNQTLKFGNQILINPNQPLASFGIQQNSIIILAFKHVSNQMPVTYAHKFYYKDVKHVRQQTQQSLTHLRSNLLVLTAHLTEDDKVFLPYFIRGLTHNLPLAYSLKCLFTNTFMSQSHRIALQEGLLVAIVNYIKSTNPVPNTLLFSDLFLHFRDFIGFCLQGIKSLATKQQIKKQQDYVQIQVNCHFTMKPIKIPRLIKIDNDDIVIVDMESMEQQIKKGFTYPLLVKPKLQNLFSIKDLEQFYHLFLKNQEDNPATNSLYLISFTKNHQNVVFPSILTVSQYLSNIENYPDMKIHQPLQIKNKSCSYLLMETKQKYLRVFVSKNKDISKPYIIFNAFTGQQNNVNLDLLSANVTTQNVEQVIDLTNLKAVITREPKQAIAVLFDISGSMSGGFFNEPDLKRIGAVKAFFQAFAFRTIAYNLQHVVSLYFFDQRVQNYCGFTEAIYDFNRLIAKAAPRGSTLMYDACVTAIQSLKHFKKKYPDCLLRILALTDGQDTGSKHSIQQTTELLIQNNIVIDSFAVGANCQGLKIISKSSGGRCYLTGNLQESLKLFQQQTVLSVRARKMDTNINKMSVAERIAIARAQPFDLPNNVHEFKMPQSNGGGMSKKQVLKNLQKSQVSNKVVSNGSLKRIAKQIQHYYSNPHPFVAIFPCSNINLWKILLLGPKQTPYQNGLFLLYAQFPGDYPFKAPQIRFITPIYHCNMNSQGRICHSVFDRNYSPALNFRQIIDCVYGLILTPEPQDPLDNVIASFYLSDYPTYLSKAKQFTLQKASLSNQKIVDQLFGKIVDDSQRKQKQKEIQQWIDLAKSFN